MNAPTAKRIVVIAGPTGVGESTVTKALRERFPVFTRLVTATTRAPRLNEREGIDYYFFSETQFKEKINNGAILEYQNNRDGIYYGSYKPDLEQKLAQGYNIIMNPDLVGAKYYKEHYGATTIFLLPDSFDVLERRLRTREPNMDPAELERRLAYARREIDEESGFYDYRVVNAQGKLENTIDQITAILETEGYALERNIPLTDRLA